MITLVQQRPANVPVGRACDAVGLPRSTLYRSLRPRLIGPKPNRRQPPRRLEQQERDRVLAVLHEPRFEDQPPAEVYATLLDEGVYLASVRTMYRILAAAGETKERRAQRLPRHYTVPRLVATRPDSVWTWDITKLGGPLPGSFFYLYVILDLFSRYVVGWMVAGRETSALAQQLFNETVTARGVEPGDLTVHMDRGSPMTSKGFTQLLAELGATKSYSRPRISDDNAYSESQFKTLKYQPDYPGRFRSIADARHWLTDFFRWYNHMHKHEGIALLTPAAVYNGHARDMLDARQAVLDARYQDHPERFPRGRPQVPRLPERVEINPVVPAYEAPNGAGDQREDLWSHAVAGNAAPQPTSKMPASIGGAAKGNDVAAGARLTT